jgi:hypothetical protein
VDTAAEIGASFELLVVADIVQDVFMPNKMETIPTYVVVPQAAIGVVGLATNGCVWNWQDSLRGL